MLLKDSLRDYVTQLSSRSPYPGGGSADDLVLALGIALLQMALGFSSLSKKTSLYQERLRVLRRKAEALIEKDAVAFKSYLRMRQKGRNDVNILWQVSKETADTAVATLKIAFQLEKFVKNSLISDLLIGIELAIAALIAAVFNLKINCRASKKKRYFTIINKYESLLKSYRRQARNLERRRLNDC